MMIISREKETLVNNTSNRSENVIGLVYFPENLRFTWFYCLWVGSEANTYGLSYNNIFIF